MKKILMVCLGNICRSPLAEGILKSKVNSETIFVDSAGTATYHVGNLPDSRSINVAHNYKVDITTQKARKFVTEDFDTFDIIYVMDQSNYQNVVNLSRNSQDIAKVKMILNEVHSGLNESVPDPYYGGDDGFEKVYKMLNEACDIVAANLSKE